MFYMLSFVTSKNMKRRRLVCATLYVCGCSEASVVSTTVHGAPSEPVRTRGSTGTLHGRGYWRAGPDDRLAEGRTDAACEWGRSLPDRDGRRTVIASHLGGQAGRQRLVPVYSSQCRRHSHQ